MWKTRDLIRIQPWFGDKIANVCDSKVAKPAVSAKVVESAVWTWKESSPNTETATTRQTPRRARGSKFAIARTRSGQAAMKRSSVTGTLNL